MLIGAPRFQLRDIAVKILAARDQIFQLLGQRKGRAFRAGSRFGLRRGRNRAGLLIVGNELRGDEFAGRRENDVVLDPFAGSGTTLKVAKALKRHYVGYELYENYRPLIETKLQMADYETQSNLFGGRL